MASFSSMLALVATAALLATASAVPNTNGELPDMVLDINRLSASLGIVTRAFSASSCAYQEGCVTGTGNRRLLAFDTATPNIGTGDLHIGAPSSRFTWDPCHSHYHYTGYAEYQLFDSQDNEMTTGRKQAFCLLDSARWGGYNGQNGPARPARQYHCSYQGISRGWMDVYFRGLDCQWIDVTDVPNGVYTLRVELNAADASGNRKLQELRYDNNVYEVSVTITGSSAGGGGSTQCNVGEWGAWSACSVSCNGGVRERTRTATGVSCPETIETEACNEFPCGDHVHVSEDGKCGSNSPFDAVCPQFQCCSQYGWCGSSDAHCNGNSQNPTGTGSSTDGSTTTTDGSTTTGGSTTDGSTTTGGSTTDGSTTTGGSTTDGSTSTDGSTTTGGSTTGGSTTGSTTGGSTTTTGGGGNGQPVQCESCWPGTSGYCKGTNGVCYGFFPGSTMCPGGTTQCHTAVEDIDCEVDPWGSWGECSQACDGGTQVRRRIVTVVPSGDGTPCPSPLEETRACNVDACDNGGGDIDCAVSAWSLWSDCDVECGGGSSTRHRTVVIPASGSGAACPTLDESRSCNTQTCDGNEPSCANCFPGTSGPCQTYNGVCWERHATTGNCPAGASPCAQTASLGAEPKVAFELTLAGLDAEDYMSNSDRVTEMLAIAMNVNPPAIRINRVTNGGVQHSEHDDVKSGRRLHGGEAVDENTPGVTLQVEVIAPQRYGRPMSPEEVASNVQKGVGDGIIAGSEVNDAGLTLQATQLDTATVNVIGADGVGDVTTNMAAAGVAGEGVALSALAVALIAVGAAVLGAGVAAFVVVKMGGSRRSKAVRVHSTRSFNTISVGPRR